MLVRSGIVTVQRPCSKNLVVCGACNARLVHRVAGPFRRSQQAHSAFQQKDLARVLGFQASTDLASTVPRSLKLPQLAGEATKV